MRWRAPYQCGRPSAAGALVRLAEQMRYVCAIRAPRRGAVRCKQARTRKETAWCSTIAVRRVLTPLSAFASVGSSQPTVWLSSAAWRAPWL
ncbi:hypothetical protein HYPSUDRAFT_589196 [Hypholoma sublateritium FD-334 SS-4]|uniref:Uncharacterized protein n=1 Tax=Hypholoma sublateritium (strain FD-334 SS-4) TaxID=945553 RepID=A0A0D2MHQ9_HYPSF|nr:hypothetical protein HYPSUDRAFT_589196 [Hypholoma sublateritium FD-334 SS-4]